MPGECNLKYRRGRREPTERGEADISPDGWERIGAGVFRLDVKPVGLFLDWVQTRFSAKGGSLMR
jgi:hypothetical protein